jgi:hypothetical protein
MADKDLQINIRTIADTTGIILTQEQLDALQAAAASGNKDAIAALKKLTDAQKEAAAAAREADREFVSGIRAAAGYGLLIGGTVAKAINDVANAQNKATKEIDKQFDSLVRNVKQWNELAKAAGSATELAGVGEKALAQIDQIQSKFREANEDNRSLFESMIDTAVAGFKNAFTFGGDPTAKGPFETINENLRDSLLQAQEIAKVQAGAAIETGLDLQAQFERRKSSGLDEAIVKTTAHLKEQQETLRHINPREHLEDWISVERTVQRITKELQLLKKAQEEAVKAGQPTTSVGVLQKQLEDLNALARKQPGRVTPIGPLAPQGTNLTPLEEKQVRDAQIATEKTLRDQQIFDEKKRRDDEAKALRDRYEKGFPDFKTPLPGGPTQIESNKELIVWLQKLYSLWQ